MRVFMKRNVLKANIFSTQYQSKAEGKEGEEDKEKEEHEPVCRQAGSCSSFSFPSLFILFPLPPLTLNAPLSIFWY
jgi:hypothetical protein